MKYFLIGLTFVVSLLLIVVVVGQESKQAGMGTAIGGGTETQPADGPGARMQCCPSSL